MTLSVPRTCTSGSDTPVELTRFSMIVWMVAMSPGAGPAPVVVTAWYSTEMPPCRSRPRRVSIFTSPLLPGRDRLGTKSMASAARPTATMRKGKRRRIGRDYIRGGGLRPPGSP